MCEYTPGCTLADDPLAVQLWNEKHRTRALKRAVLVFRCHEKRHPTGAVFDLPTLGRVLLSPHQSMVARTAFGEPADPDEVVHQHAELVPLADIKPGQRFFGRCSCAVWAFDVHAALNSPEPWGLDSHGVPYMIGSLAIAADKMAEIRRAEG